MCKPIKHGTERCRSINDSRGYKFLNDAIIDSERICASIFREVEPQNLLFIFGQTIQSLGYAPIEFLLIPPLFYERDYINGHRYNKEGNDNNEGKPKHRAVILCELKHTDTFKELIACKEKEGGHDSERYEIAWSELQELKKRFSSIRNHIYDAQQLLDGRTSQYY